MTRPLKRVGFGFEFYPLEKFGLGPGQAQTRPVDTPKLCYKLIIKLGENIILELLSIW